MSVASPRRWIACLLLVAAIASVRADEIGPIRSPYSSPDEPKKLQARPDRKDSKPTDDSAVWKAIRPPSDTPQSNAQKKNLSVPGESIPQEQAPPKELQAPEVPPQLQGKPLILPPAALAEPNNSARDPQSMPPPRVIPGLPPSIDSEPVEPKADPTLPPLPDASTSIVESKPASTEVLFKATWHDGVVFESSNKRFKFHVGGRDQFDVAWMVAPKSVQFGAGGVGRTDDATNFRRARLTADGTLYGTIDFWAEFDFLNTFIVDRNAAGIARPANTPVPTDLWLTFTQLPRIGNLRVGNQKPPIGFEHATSSRFLNFMERSMGFDAFIEDQDNGFRPGIQIFNTAFDERMTLAVGYFKHTRNIFGWNTGDGEGDVTGRITMLPIYRDEGRYLVHLGVGASHRDLDDHVARFRGRTSVRNGPAVLHTILADASMVGKNQQLIVPEMVIVWGPLSFESEYFATWVQGAAIPAAAPPRVPQGTVFFRAYTVGLHYFLTGEHRPYNRKTGGFNRVIPRRNAHWGKVCEEDGPGYGAWQVLVRYQFLDLEDKGVNGSIVNEFTAGLNWFLNPNMKVQWNYSLADRNAAGNTSDGVIHSFGTRLAWDF